MSGSSSVRDLLVALFNDHGVEVEHSGDVLRQAEAWARSPDIDDPTLEDLDSVPFVTLDSRHARDLDQALHVEARGRGHLVRYAIADASHYVLPGTPLWDEALRRGASYYLPGVMAPMLPRVLSEDVVSLNPGVARRAMVFHHELDADGVCLRTHVSQARIRSRAKLGFAETQAFLDGGVAPRGLDDVARSLSALREVGERRMRLADERGVVRFRRAEVEVRAAGGTKGAPRFTAIEALEYEVENYNEQLSLLCNIEGAALLQADAPPGLVQPIYRAHPPPTEHALADFESMVAALVRTRGKTADVWGWDRSTMPLSRYLAGLPEGGVEGRLARAIHRQALLVGGRAVYTEEPAAHHGIGATAYARFSAPMREIVGVFCHKELLEGLAGVARRRLPGVPSDDDLRTRVIRAATQAKTLQKRLERAANRLVIDELLGADRRVELGARPGRSGTLMGLGRGKAHVRLDDPPIDLKVYVRHLENDEGRPLDIGSDGVGLFAGKSPVLTVGDRVEVVVMDRDESTDRWRIRCRRSES